MALRGHGIVVYLSIRRTNGEAVSPWLIAIWVTCDRAPGTPAVRGVVDALANHRVVAIAEAHLLRQANEFYVSLVRDTGFQRIAPDIVIEFASRQSQPLLDRYVMRGDSLPLDLAKHDESGLVGFAGRRAGANGRTAGTVTAAA
jgi:hypothetical protein